jgi:hypothetical protein
MDNEVFSTKIQNGSRTYFFDIKKSEQGGFYLTISESKKTGDQFERHRIMIFEEDICDFSDGFQKTIGEFRKISKIKAYSVEDIRKQYPNAYAPWSADDDAKLESLFCEGTKVKKIAQIFGRNEGAINSRIKKLELNEKYGVSELNRDYVFEKSGEISNFAN